MNQPRKPFVSIAPDIDDEAIEAVAARKGVSSLRPAMARPAASPAGQASDLSLPEPDVRPTRENQLAMTAGPVIAPRPRLHSTKVAVPDYAMRELKSRAVRDEVTINHILLKALDQFGIAIKPDDLIEDGRRRKT